MNLPYIEPYKIKTVEAITPTTREEREEHIRQAKYNLFSLKSRHVTIDMLTDSGTGAMSDRQWAAMMTGDESYAGSRSYEELKETIQDILGFDLFLPTHQGRAAENVLFSALVKEGDIVPGNSHFDTTKGHIEFRRASAVDCTISEASDPALIHPFKGNIDIQRLEEVLDNAKPGSVPLVLITLTCNTSGGQPVSMANIKAVNALCRERGIPVFVDGARFAENAYFIKTREEEYQSHSIRQIVKEIFDLVDGMTMSSKKDGIVNMGGFVTFRDRDLYEKASTYAIMYEGFISYGGMAGRDMAALAQGLREVVEFSYLESRIRQIKLLSDELQRYGVPLLQPAGGHAVFIDAAAFFDHIPREEFPAQLLGVELYREGGVRGVEVGTLLADRCPKTRENRYPALELLRLAVPRRVYTDNHIRYTAAVVGAVYNRRKQITRGLKILKEAPIMRHFTVELDLISE